MASEPDPSSPLARELAALSRALVRAERSREQRLAERLAELDAWMSESARVQRLITGGASHREARLRALESTVEALAAERARLVSPPRPLDIPRRGGLDPSRVKIHSVESDPDESEPPGA